MALRRKSGYTAKRTSFYKCKKCYSAGRFCTHTSTKSSRRGGGRAYGYRSTGFTGSKKTYRRGIRGSFRKKGPEPTKIDVPVADESGAGALDSVPLNGVRVRCTRLTNPLPVQCESKKFTGSVCWRGVTDRFDFEMNGEGPFLHRRILFQGPWDLKFEDVDLVSKGAPSSEWRRSPAVSLRDPDMSEGLCRMFGASATVRDLLFGTVKAHGVNVFEDRRKQYEGKASGTRRYDKHFKGFGKTGRGAFIKYAMQNDGTTDGDVADDEKYFHIYAMDIFQYGINGLDERIVAGGVVGKKRASDGGSSTGSVKRHKSDSSYEDVSMEGLRLEGGGVSEQPASGMVRVVSHMKLYWYDPK